jgi:predicted Zn-dependent protease
VQLATGKARDAALVELAAIADQGVKQRAGSFSRPVAGDQRARQALGAAYVAIGDLAAATRELRRVVEETSIDRPDPYAYRTHQLLAEVAIAQHDLALADAEIEAALKIHPGNAYSRVVQAKIKLRANEPDRALEALAPLRKSGELPPAAKLVVAEALVSRKGVTADQRAQAKALVTEVAGKLQPAEVGRVAALIDPKLPAELALPIANLPKQKT